MRISPNLTTAVRCFLAHFQAVARLLDRATLDIVRQRLSIFQRIKANITALTSCLDGERAASARGVRGLTDVLIPMSNLKPLRTRSLRLQLRRALAAGMCDSVIAFGKGCLRRFEYHAKMIAQLLRKGKTEAGGRAMYVVPAGVQS